MKVQLPVAGGAICQDRRGFMMKIAAGNGLKKAATRVSSIIHRFGKFELIFGRFLPSVTVQVSRSCRDRALVPVVVSGAQEAQVALCARA